MSAYVSLRQRFNQGLIPILPATNLKILMHLDDFGQILKFKYRYYIQKRTHFDKVKYHF
jgi:hypothetical protein